MHDGHHVRLSSKRRHRASLQSLFCVRTLRASHRMEVVMTRRLTDAERADIEVELASIRQEMRRRRIPATVAETVEWEQEFGAEFEALRG